MSPVIKSRGACRCICMQGMCAHGTACHRAAMCKQLDRGTAGQSACITAVWLDLHDMSIYVAWCLVAWCLECFGSEELTDARCHVPCKPWNAANHIYALDKLALAEPLRLLCITPKAAFKQTAQCRLGRKGCYVATHAVNKLSRAVNSRTGPLLRACTTASTPFLQGR